jgi:phage repressor protein C with HTH and peptisase S24 domain
MGNWASFAIEILKAGEMAKVKPRGNSMLPIIKSGSTVTLKPINNDEIKTNDIVLVRVKGNVYLHLVKAIQDKRYLIGNNRGRINGWVGYNSIFGKAIKIENK